MKNKNILDLRYRISFLIILFFSITLIRDYDSNVFLNMFITFIFYSTLIISPMIIGRFGTIASIVVVLIGIIFTFHNTWTFRDRYYMMITSYNIAAIISVIIIDYLYTKLKRNELYYKFESITDGLTKLHNRRYFDHRLEFEWNLFIRDNQIFYLILIDIDYFKSINDKYGHKIGDDVLIYISSILKSNVRITDEAFRVGGDEFALLLPKSTKSGVELIIQRIQAELQNINIDENVTLSIGCSRADKKYKDITGLYNAADKALYGVKESGRNGCQFNEDI